MSRDINNKFWDEELETLPREELEKRQLADLQEIVKFAYDHAPYYKRSFDEAGVKPEDIKTLKDIQKFPFINKTTQRDTQGVGSFLGELAAVPEEDVVFISTSSGSTGVPTMSPFTKKDFDEFQDTESRWFWQIGMRPNDRYVHALNFSLYVGGPDVIGAQNLGALCIWGGTLPSERLLFVLKTYQPTVIWTSPSYAWQLGEKALKSGIDPKKDLNIKKILCNPSNPCGKVFTYDELKTIADLAEKYDTFVITDEVYEHIVYEPYKHTYFASLPGMWERTISCSSLSKTYSITGWRLGYIIAPKEVIEVAKKVHDFLTVGAAAPLQEAAVTGLRFGDDYYKDLQAKYTEKRDLFLRGLDDIGIVHTVPQGAYYILLDISEFGYESDLEFCEVLARDVGVGAVPGSSFFREDVNHLIRLHFAKKNETLYEALNRLEHIRNKIAKR